MCHLAWTDTACLSLGAFNGNVWRTLTLGQRFHQFYKAFPQTCVSSLSSASVIYYCRFCRGFLDYWQGDDLCVCLHVRVCDKERYLLADQAQLACQSWTRTWKWLQKAFKHFHFIYQHCASAYIFKVVWHIPMWKKGSTMLPNHCIELQWAYSPVVQ